MKLQLTSGGSQNLITGKGGWSIFAFRWQMWSSSESTRSDVLDEHDGGERLLLACAPMHSHGVTAVAARFCRNQSPIGGDPVERVATLSD